MIDLSNSSVSIVLDVQGYPSQEPFHPSQQFPESPYSCPLIPGNHVYPAVREAMRLLRMDGANYGTSAWNPLGELVKSGDRVLIKPNFVLDKNYGSGPIEAVITHGSMLRAIADYVIIALRGQGQLTIADAPQMNCNWQRLLSVCGIGSVAEHLAKVCGAKGIEFSFYDLRQEETTYKFGIVWERKRLQSPEGRTVEVDLAEQSLMREIDTARLYGADYDRSTTLKAHAGNRHLYRIARQVMEADVLISVPKLKVHSKVGTTLNIKNMVGVNTDKNHLAHYRLGPPAKGGDEFSNPSWDDKLDRALMNVLLGHYWAWGKYPFAGWRALRKILRKLVPRRTASFAYGNWSGNDTAWRMALDLNRAILMADRNGTLHDTAQRRYFAFIDGVIGGEGNGPLHPDAVNSGVVIAGSNPLGVDWVATKLMGLDPKRIAMYERGRQEFARMVPGYSPEVISVLCGDPRWKDLLSRGDTVFRFKPAPGWKGSVECYQPEPINSGELAESREID